MCTQPPRDGSFEQFQSGAFPAYVPDRQQVKVYPVGSGGQPTVVSSQIADTSDTVNFLGFSPNGDALLYVAPESRVGYSDLYLVDLEGGSPSISERVSTNQADSYWIDFDPGSVLISR